MSPVRRHPSARAIYRATCLAVGLMAGAPAAGVAQDVPTSRGPCFSHPVRDVCGSWWVFEIAGHVPLAVSSETLMLDNQRADEEPAFGAHVSWDVGYMRRFSEQNAIGVVGMAGVGWPGERWGIKGRYGRDLPGDHSLDLSAGWLYAQVGGYGDRKGQGVTADLRVSRGDWISGGLRYDWVSTDPLPEPDPIAHFYPTAQALYGGVILRQRAGLYSTAALAAIFGGYALLFWLGTGPDY